MMLYVALPPPLKSRYERREDEQPDHDERARSGGCTDRGTGCGGPPAGGGAAGVGGGGGGVVVAIVSCRAGSGAGAGCRVGGARAAARGSRREALRLPTGSLGVSDGAAALVATDALSSPAAVAARTAFATTAAGVPRSHLVAEAGGGEPFGAQEVSERVVAVGVLAPRKMKSMIRSRPPVPRRLVEQFGQRLRCRLGGVAEFFELVEQRQDPHQRGAGDLRRAPRPLKYFSDAREKPGSSTNAFEMYGAALAAAGRWRSFRRRNGRCGPSRAELFEERGERCEVFFQRRALVRRGLRDLFAFGDEVRELRAHAGPWPQRLVGVDRELREHLVLARKDREHLFEFRERRVRALDDRVQVAAPVGEPGTEFVEDDREALAFGKALDVSEQVDVDGAVVVARRAADTGLRLPARRGSASAAAAAAPLRTRG